jgi:exonuclease III
LTGVYGPQGDLDKRMFLRELKRIKNLVQTPWLLLGDFNLIYKEHDKNNGRLNRRLMPRFRKVLNQLEVKEVDLVGKKFTWSNNQDPSTLTRIDHAFCTLN